MSVQLPPLGELLPIAGVRLAAVAAGVRYPGRHDVVLLELAAGTTAAACFTQNRFRAAPVLVAERHLRSHAPRFLLINSGNANAGTGAPGLEAALACCRALGELTETSLETVLPFSTGVIGEPLPAQRIIDALPALLAGLDEQGWADAARAIMTTDTGPKALSMRTPSGITLTGMAKGAGMIRPDMATMLAYVATDAQVDADVLDSMTRRAVQRSFNCITVDGDTSTNDSVVVVATGGSSAPAVTRADDALGKELADALDAICLELAQRVIRDGEGATRFVTVAVDHARSEDEARRVAFTIAESPLVKTALFAGDPNWGRLLAAIGRAGIDDLDVAGVDLWLGDVHIATQGAVAPAYREADGAAVMAAEEVVIRVALGRGDASATVWTTDLSYDYVKINAEYRS